MSADLFPKSSSKYLPEDGEIDENEASNHNADSKDDSKFKERSTIASKKEVSTYSISSSSERRNYNMSDTNSRSHSSYDKAYSKHRTRSRSRDSKRQRGYSEHERDNTSRSRNSSRYSNESYESRKSRMDEKQDNSRNSKDTTHKRVSPVAEKPRIDEEIQEIDFNLEDDSEEAELKLLEERRKKRQAILAKHSHLKAEFKTSSSFPTPDFNSAVQSPFDLSKVCDQEVKIPISIEKIADSNSSSSPEPSCFAADYNPDLDREAERLHVLEQSSATNVKSTALNGDTNEAKNLSLDTEVEKVESGSDGDFDMFGDEVHEPTAPKENFSSKSGISINQALQDNWDDHEGYYRVTLGEILAERYHVFSILGKGVFSSVVKAKDLENNDLDVAIKIIRNNETMYRLGMKEIDILKKLTETDPKGKRHIVRFLHHFEYRGHLCVVFESLNMNLREVLKKFGKDVGLSIKAVKAYAQQLFLALSLMEKCSVIHADIKPDNIIVNDTHNTLKVCDLGSASYTSDNEITPYLVSRFYRAPEIILGLPYNTAIDVWSVGCTLYEIYTGKMLFPGRNNNHMLKLMMDLKGKLSNKMVKRGSFSSKHFDADFNFLYDNSGVIKKPVFTKPHRELKQRLVGISEVTNEEELRLVHLLVDLIDRCTQLNPEHRIGVHEALNHPFLSQ